MSLAAIDVRAHTTPGGYVKRGSTPGGSGGAGISPAGAMAARTWS
jgi:hypothetical protein